MKRLYILGLVALAALIIGIAWAEQITFSTYYPAPYGVYREMQVQQLHFQEDVDGIVNFNYPDTTYDRRLRVTAGRADTANNDQGACIDLHGNNAGGRLDLVAGRGGYTSFWTSPTGSNAEERMRITDTGNVGIGVVPGATNRLEVVGGPIKATGGLIIQTTVPTSPVTGQMWLQP